MATLNDNANAVSACATAIDAAITAKGGTLVGGGKLRNAAAGIASIPTGGSYDEPQGGWINDGNTHFWITVDSFFPSITISIINNGNQNVVIRWGDGSSSNIGNAAVNSTHTYSQIGDYRIDIEGTTPTLIGVNDNYGVFFQSAASYAIRCYYAEIGTSVTHLKKTFQACYSLRSVKLSSTNVVFTGTFDGCYSLFKISNISNLTDVGSSSFYNCYSLIELLLNNVLTLGSSAFRNCLSLEKFVVNDGVTSIGSTCFYGLKSLKEVRLPSTLTSIGANAFMYVNGVPCDYYIDATNPPTIDSTTFTGANISHIYVPSGSVETYKTATNWSSIANKIYAKPE